MTNSPSSSEPNIPGFSRPLTPSQPDDAAAPLRYPELPPELAQPRLSTMLRLVGPGAILASITIGSGETVFASRSGAVFGFSILWLFLFGTLAKGLQIYSGARHITLTGQHPLASWNQVRYLRGWFPIIIATISVLCFPFWLGGLPKMLGTLVNWIVGVEAGEIGSAERAHYAFMVKMWGTGFVAAAITITLLQSYKLLENVQMIIVGFLLLSLLAAAIASKPDLLEVLTGSFLPTLPQYPQWALEKYPGDFGTRPLLRELAVYVGALGGGTQDYLGYMGVLREKGWGLMKRFSSGNPSYGPGQIALPLEQEQVARGLRWLRAPKTDILVSFTCILIFTYAFVTLGAQVLHVQQLAPSGTDLLTTQKDFLAQIHGSLTYLYQVGVFMAFFGTIYGAFEIYTRTAHECLIVVIPALRTVSVRKVRPWVLAYCGIGALTLLWSEIDAVNIVTPAAILGSVLTCGLWCLASVWAERELLPRPYRMPRWLAVLVVVSGVLLTLLGVGAAIQFFGDLPMH